MYDTCHYCMISHHRISCVLHRPCNCICTGYIMTRKIRASRRAYNDPLSFSGHVPAITLIDNQSHLCNRSPFLRLRHWLVWWWWFGREILYEKDLILISQFRYRRHAATTSINHMYTHSELLNHQYHPNPIWNRSLSSPQITRTMPAYQMERYCAW